MNIFNNVINERDEKMKCLWFRQCLFGQHKFCDETYIFIGRHRVCVWWKWKFSDISCFLSFLVDFDSCTRHLFLTHCENENVPLEGNFLCSSDVIVYNRLCCSWIMTGAIMWKLSKKKLWEFCEWRRKVEKFIKECLKIPAHTTIESS